MSIVIRIISVLGAAAALISCDQPAKPKSASVQENQESPTLPVILDSADSGLPSDTQFTEVSLDTISIPESAREESINQLIMSDFWDHIVDKGFEDATWSNSVMWTWHFGQARPYKVDGHFTKTGIHTWHADEVFTLVFPGPFEGRDEPRTMKLATAPTIQEATELFLRAKRELESR